jgi:hypothetical protein
MKYFFPILVIAILCSQCKKTDQQALDNEKKENQDSIDAANKVDYRDKFIGSYLTTSTTHYVEQNQFVHIDTTYANNDTTIYVVSKDGSDTARILINTDTFELYGGDEKFSTVNIEGGWPKFAHFENNAMYRQDNLPTTPHTNKYKNIYGLKQ